MEAGDVDHVVPACAAALEDFADPRERAVVGELEVGLAVAQAGDDPGQVDRVADDHRVGIAPILLELPLPRILGQEHGRLLARARLSGTGEQQDRQ